MPQKSVGNISIFAMYTDKNAHEIPSFATITNSGIMPTTVYENMTIKIPPKSDSAKDS